MDEVHSASDAKESQRAQAVRLYAEALAHRDRGEYRQAVARLRDVVKLDPEGVEAMQEMASLLYMSGDYERSLQAYQLVLQRQPLNRAAILGAARVHRQQQEYESAAESLRSWLRYNPNDGEAWMALGDIGVFKGDEVLARECYVRAMHAKSGNAAIAQDAQERLTMMSETRRDGK
jgi:cytochrome c-type biogenesis protein CcmH/NrfG